LQLRLQPQCKFYGRRADRHEATQKKNGQLRQINPNKGSSNSQKDTKINRAEKALDDEKEQKRKTAKAQRLNLNSKLFLHK